MSKKISLVLFLANASLSFLNTAYAGDKDDAREIVVTATRTPQSAPAGIASVIVIDRETIAASQAKDVAELLRFHAGLDIGRNGGPGQTTSIFIRGGESNHTLVLVDGVKINPGTIGGAAIQNLDPSLIDRIEIVKGPRSTLYGSEAIGGVIQIFTRRGRPGTTWNASVGAGADRTREMAAGYHHDGKDLTFGIDISSFDTDGFPARVGAVKDSGHDNTSVNAYLRFDTGRFKTELSHLQSRGNTEYYGFFLEPLDQDFVNAVTALTLKGPVTGTWATTLKLSRMRDEIDQNQGGDFAHTRRDVLDWQNDIQLNDANLLTTGLLLSRESTKAASYGTGFDEDTDVGALFVQNQMRSGRQRLLSALRYTYHETFGGEVTGDVRYAFEIDPKATLFGTAGTGFRAPDSTDRFGFGGNPGLDPETSRNFELGLRLAPAPAHKGSVTLFQNDLNDLISFSDPDGYFGPTPGRNENIDKARIRGIEARYALSAAPWFLDLEAAIQDPKNRVTGRQLARRAKRSVTATVRYQGDGYTLGANLLATGERPDSDFSATMNPGYTLVNVFAEKRLGAHWRLRARIENLLDRRYTLADGYNTQDRAFYVQLKYGRYNRGGGI